MQNAQHNCKIKKRTSRTAENKQRNSDEERWKNNWEKIQKHYSKGKLKIFCENPYDIY